jgi:hypothetical protein
MHQALWVLHLGEGLKPHSPDARLEEDEFLWVGQMHALDHDLDGRAPLTDPRPHPLNVALHAAGD